MIDDGWSLTVKGTAVYQGRSNRRSEKPGNQTAQGTAHTRARRGAPQAQRERGAVTRSRREVSRADAEVLPGTMASK